VVAREGVGAERSLRGEEDGAGRPREREREEVGLGKTLGGEKP
jgi:hypothetical protein